MKFILLTFIVILFLDFQAFSKVRANKKTAIITKDIYLNESQIRDVQKQLRKINSRGDNYNLTFKCYKGKADKNSKKKSLKCRAVAIGEDI